MTTKLKLVFGWGVNDVNYAVTKYGIIDGKLVQVWICPYYEKWRGILERCFDPKFHVSRPTYVNCTVDPEWKYLSNFIKWIDSQPNRDWQNCQPDKDLLNIDNKHYSANTVVFISSKVNNFILDSKNIRGSYMLGVTYRPNNSSKKPYVAQCQNPFGTNKSDGRYLGYFSTEIEAHKAWQAKKHEIALCFAEEQQDLRVVKALRERYAPDKDWTTK